jgi:hypothetical protein
MTDTISSQNIDLSSWDTRIRTHKFAAAFAELCKVEISVFLQLLFIVIMNNLVSWNLYKEYAYKYDGQTP